MTTSRLPKLPKLLDRKLYKTGQTRGADDDLIYQNRVARNSTVLIPYDVWDKCRAPYDREPYENGHIVLIPPEVYFDIRASDKLDAQNLTVGKNLLLFYNTREQWERYDPRDEGWKPANSRQPPLGGHFVARVPATTSSKAGERISEGFNTSKLKGAGIRVYEYASARVIRECRLQLEAIFWHCADAEEVLSSQGMSSKEIYKRRSSILQAAGESDLIDQYRLRRSRAVNIEGDAICPLCLEPLSAAGFLSRVTQAKGREVRNLTVTEINLFHIDELRPGSINHVPYNLAWGHHHCNIVVRDLGIDHTIKWMLEVIENNRRAQYIRPSGSRESLRHTALRLGGRGRRRHRSTIG